MRGNSLAAHWILLLSFLLAAAPQATAQETASATVRQLNALPQPQPAAAVPSGGTVVLSSDGTKTSLIGRIGWIGTAWNVGLSLEAPIDKPEDEVTLVDADGLAGSTVATLSLARSFRVVPSTTPLRTCEALNRGLLDAHRRALGIESLNSPVPFDQCTPDAIGQLGRFGEKAIRGGRERALTALCDELAKLQVIAPRIGERQLEVAMAGRECAPAYLPAVCGSTDADEVAEALAELELQTREYRPAAAGKKPSKELESLDLTQVISSLEAVDQSQRTAEQRLNLALAKQRLELLQRQLASPAVVDPRTWFDLALRNELRSSCAAANALPLDKLIDTTEQNAPGKGCELAAVDAVLAASRLSGAERRRYALAAREDLLPVVWLGSVSASAGEQSFKFRDAATLSSKAEAKLNKAVTAAVTRASGVDGWSLGYTWHETYKGGKKVLLCEPLEGTAGEVCADAVLAAPKRDEDDKSSVFLEYRRFLSPALAFGGRAFYRDGLDQWGVRNTWYFLAKDKVGLDGGVELGWDRKIEIVDAAGALDEDGGFVARLFVGRTFELFPLGK